MAKDAKVRMNSKVQKYTTLAELEKDDKGPVFVMNASTGDLQGQILINVPKKNGNGSDIVRIPKTYIPIDLTAQVPRGQLMEASEFRKTVTNKLVKVVTPEYAQLLLSSEEGKEEKRRIENEMQKARTALQNAGVTSSDDEEEDEDDGFVEAADVGREAKRAANKQAAKSKGTEKISMKLQAIVASADEDELSQSEIVGKLLNYNDGELTIHELAWLKKKYDNKPRIMKHLRTKYAELKAAA